MKRPLRFLLAVPALAGPTVGLLLVGQPGESAPTQPAVAVPGKPADLKAAVGLPVTQ